MKRDMDLVREILLTVECDDAPHTGIAPISGYSSEQCVYHVGMLEKAGFLVEVRGRRWVEEIDDSIVTLEGYSLTWEGHEFLDTIRDPEIWAKTKEGAKSVGTWSVGFIAELGKGYLKAKAVELGLPVT